MMHATKTPRSNEYLDKVNKLRQKFTQNTPELFSTLQPTQIVSHKKLITNKTKKQIQKVFSIQIRKAQNKVLISKRKKYPKLFCHVVYLQQKNGYQNYKPLSLFIKLMQIVLNIELMLIFEPNTMFNQKSLNITTTKDAGLNNNNSFQRKSLFHPLARNQQEIVIRQPTLIDKSTHLQYSLKNSRYIFKVRIAGRQIGGMLCSNLL
eukprot:TRINITY_DN3866_c0_g1_i2.p2 TRINITY_DN3866_c0_g1~~TRINITY_DN3866_c0_g1_i2.p2  ORF type:complete len:206 (-),score=-4.93 TRINITY_DN3866_c0_g1_i2:776-1393(-)